RGIAAAFHLAPVGIEYPHGEIRALALLQQDQLVAPDAGSPVGNGARELLRDRRKLRLTGVEDDEVVSQPMHLDESYAHDRPAPLGAGPVNRNVKRKEIQLARFCCSAPASGKSSASSVSRSSSRNSTWPLSSSSDSLAS